MFAFTSSSPTRRRVRAGVVIAAAAALLVSACGSGSDPNASTAAPAPATSSTAAAAPASSGADTGSSAAGTEAPASSAPAPAAPTKQFVMDTVFVIKSADPARNYEPTGNVLARALYDTLVSFKGDDLKTPVPMLATKWETSEDKKTYTFHLDPKATFSDGTPVTSADVVFSLQRAGNVKGNPSFLVDGMTFTAKDPQTVVVTTKEYDAAVLGKLASPSLGILNSAKVKAAGGSDAADAATADKAEAALNKESMGSGPYVLSTFGLSTEIQLVPSEKYWGATPATFSKVIIRNVPAEQQKNNVVKGESQLATDLSPDQAKGVSGGAATTSVPSQYTFYLFTNANPSVNKWTANADFQNAIRQGINYDGLIELGGEGAKRAAGMIPVQFAGSLPADKAPKYDVEAAKASLKKSGYDGSTIEISYPSDLTQNGVSFTDMSTRIGADLEKVGIKVELKGAPVATVLELARGGKQQVGVWLWGPDWPDASNYLAFGPGGVVGGKRVNWQPGTSPEIEAVMKKAATETDDAARVKLYEQYQELLNKGPVMSLIQPAQVFVSSTDLKGLSYNLLWTVNIRELSFG